MRYALAIVGILFFADAAGHAESQPVPLRSRVWGSSGMLVQCIDLAQRRRRLNLDIILLLGDNRPWYKEDFANETDHAPRWSPAR